MEYSKTAIYSDLDATMLDTGGRLSPESLDAVERYTALGGLFALSTGRAPRNAARYCAGLRTNAPSIVFNGAAVYDYTTGEGRLLSGLDMSAAGAVVRRCLAELPGADVQVYTEDEIIYLTPLETANRAFLDIHLPCRYMPVEEAVKLQWVKCLVLGGRSETAWLDAMIPEYLDALDYVKGACDFIPEEYSELLPKGANKGSALRLLRAEPFAAGRTIIAAGDYRNDRELLLEADVAVAPSNALDEIKAICGHIGPDNDHHLIKYIIDELIPSL